MVTMFTYDTTDEEHSNEGLALRIADALKQRVIRLPSITYISTPDTRNTITEDARQITISDLLKMELRGVHKKALLSAAIIAIEEKYHSSPTDKPKRREELKHTKDLW